VGLAVGGGGWGWVGGWCLAVGLVVGLVGCDVETHQQCSGHIHIHGDLVCLVCTCHSGSTVGGKRDTPPSVPDIPVPRPPAVGSDLTALRVELEGILVLLRA
jgi:hypothetical protein